MLMLTLMLINDCSVVMVCASIIQPANHRPSICLSIQQKCINVHLDWRGDYWWDQESGMDLLTGRKDLLGESVLIMSHSN